jgi:hypothetical protein
MTTTDIEKFAGPPADLTEWNLPDFVDAWQQGGSAAW